MRRRRIPMDRFDRYLLVIVVVGFTAALTIVSTRAVLGQIRRARRPAAKAAPVVPAVAPVPGVMAGGRLDAPSGPALPPGEAPDYPLAWPQVVSWGGLDV